MTQYSKIFEWIQLLDLIERGLLRECIHIKTIIGITIPKTISVYRPYFGNTRLDTNRSVNRVPTVLEKTLNFGFSLKSPWKWICPWKVLEFRGPSLKFQLVVLDFLFCVFWTESLNGYSKLRGTRASFSTKNSARFARSSLQVKYFSSSSCSYIILEQVLSYPSFL